MMRTSRRSVFITGVLIALLARNASTQTASPPQPAVDTVKELEALKQRITQLESELKKTKTCEQPSAANANQAAPTTPKGQQPAKEGDRTASEAKGDALKKLDALKLPIEQLESGSKGSPAKEQPSTAEISKPAQTSPVAAAEPAKTSDAANGSGDDAVGSGQVQVAQAQAATVQAPVGQAAPTPATPPVDLDTPFAFSDFTWMNAVPRNHDEVLDGKYFSGEFRVDTNYIYDWQRPYTHRHHGRRADR